MNIKISIENTAVFLLTISVIDLVPINTKEKHFFGKL